MLIKKIGHSIYELYNKRLRPKLDGEFFCSRIRYVWLQLITLAKIMMIVDTFRTTIVLGDWTLFSPSSVVSIAFRLPLGS